MVEIQFGLVGVGQPRPSTIEMSIDEFDIQFSMIDTIAGGFVGGGASSSARKRHYRSIYSVSYLPQRSQPPITFSNADFSNNDPKQDNPVVVTAAITNWRVHKIVID